uniref:Alcohol acetyltransferase n=1 Tax=Sphingobacterium sp. (strain 21) TaxID=743722 RepID=F4C2H9_SPHS2
MPDINVYRKERPLLFLERTLVGDGTEPFNGVFAIRLKGKIEHESLAAALAKLQAKYLQLQMAIAEITSPKPYFFIPDTISPIPLTVKEWQHANQWQEEALAGLRLKFDVVKGPMFHVSCLSNHVTSDLILSFHHCICDGGGGVLLIRELLTFLDGKESNIDKQNRLLRIDDIIPIEVRKSKINQVKTSCLSGLLKTALSISAIFTSTKNSGTLTRSRDYLLHSKLDRESTSIWVSICKKHGVTVNTAIGLLLLKAYEKVAGPESKNKISCPVDIRKLAKQIRENQLFSFGMVLTLTNKKANHKSFWPEAQILQTVVDKQIKALKPYEFLMTFEKLHSALPRMIKMLTYGKVGNDLMFSNIGRIPLENEYQNFSLETVFSPMVIGPFANPSTIICSTFNDELDFSFVSNEGFLPQEKAKSIIEFVRNEMILLITSAKKNHDNTT